MGYKFIERRDIEQQSLMAALRGDLDSLDGWSIWDDQLGTDLNPANGTYFVMRMDTSEGAGNELYVQFNKVNDENIDVKLGGGWDQTAHTWIGPYIDHSRHYYDGGSTSPLSLRSYFLSGDSDHAIISLWSQNVNHRSTPIYVGLIDLLPGDTGKRSAVLAARYVTTTTDLYYNVYQRLPILYGWDGGFNGYGRMCKETLFIRNRDHEGFLGFGPWGDDKYIYTSMISIWENNWGIRGYLKNTRLVSDAYSTGFVTGDTVLINGQEYYFWYTTDTDVNVSRHGGWSLFKNSTGIHRHALFIRKTED